MENKKEKNKRRSFIIILIIFSCIFLFISFKNFIDISILYNSVDNSIHFDLITVNSIFSGFLFSSLSLIVGLNGTKSINKFEKAGFMENIYFNIIFGITTSILSIAFSLFMLFGYKLIDKIYFLYKFLIPTCELLFLLLTIIIFIKAVFDVTFIIKSVRRNLKGKYDDEDINETLKQIK